MFKNNLSFTPILLSTCFNSGKHNRTTAKETIKQIENEATNQSVQTDKLIKIDVTKNYPTKEICLQDIADIEYVPLETNKDFICTGGIVTITNTRIVTITNTRIVMWVPLTLDILIVDRKGKALKKINRKELPGEEYLEIRSVVLNESANELYVNARTSFKKILAYNLDGYFKSKIQKQFLNIS